MWEHRVGAPCATGARASRQSPLLGALDPPYCTVPLTALAPAPPDSEHLTCLSIPCWSQRGWCLCFLVRPPRLHLGAGLLIVSKNFSPETHTASPFPPEFYLHCKW